MKNLVLTLVVFIVVSFSLSACATSGPVKPPASIYFPTTPGMDLKFDIQIGEAMPLRLSNTVALAQSYGDINVTSIRDYLNPDIVYDKDARYPLELKIVGATGERICNLGTDLKLEIINDPLGVYNYPDYVESLLGIKIRTSSLYWDFDGPFVNEIVSYQFENVSSKSGPCSARPIATNGTTDSIARMWSMLGDEDWYNSFPDRIDFLEIDTRYKGYEGQNILHVHRTVLPMQGKDPKEYVNQPFMEDYWYKEDFGLIRFEQKVNGILSMTWVRTE